MPSLSCPSQDRLRQLVHGEALDDGALSDHVSACADCARIVARLRHEEQRTRDSADEDATLPPSPSATSAGFGFLAPPQAPDEMAHKKLTKGEPVELGTFEHGVRKQKGGGYKSYTIRVTTVTGKEIDQKGIDKAVDASTQESKLPK